MAFEENVVYSSVFKAGADLSAAANQFRAVKLHTAAGQVVAAAAATDIVLGILAEHPASGAVAKFAEIDKGGIAKVRIGASQDIAIGDKLTAATGGLLVEASSTNQVCAIAIEAVVTGVGEDAVIAAKLVRMVAP